MCERENCAESRPGVLLGMSPLLPNPRAWIKQLTAPLSQNLWNLNWCSSCYAALRFTHINLQYKPKISTFSLIFVERRHQERRLLHSQPGLVLSTQWTHHHRQKLLQVFFSSLLIDNDFSPYTFSVFTLILLALPNYGQRRSFRKQDQLSLQPELCMSLEHTSHHLLFTLQPKRIRV